MKIIRNKAPTISAAPTVIHVSWDEPRKRWVASIAGKLVGTHTNRDELVSPMRQTMGYMVRDKSIESIIVIHNKSGGFAREYRYMKEPN